MLKIFRHKIALCFAIFFMAIIAAPSVIISIDNKADVSLFFGENEEEEKENLKLLFNVSLESKRLLSVMLYNQNVDHYSIKNYQRPSLNLFLPPPE